MKMDSSLNQKDVHLEQVMPLFRQQLAQGGRVRFGPRGTSMLPMLRQGIDTVELGPLPQRLKKYDVALYQRKNGQYVLHRVVAVGDTYTCIGDNQFQLEEGLTHDQMIAVVTAFYRGEKRWEADCPSYRLYCRLWHFTRPVRRLWLGVKARLRRLFKK